MLKEKNNKKKYTLLVISLLCSFILGAFLSGIYFWKKTEKIKRDFSSAMINVLSEKFNQKAAFESNKRSVKGTIEQIEGKKIRLKDSGNGDLQYTVIVSPETKVVKTELLDVSKNSAYPQKKINPIKETPINFSDFSIGNAVAVISETDIAQNGEIRAKTVALMQ